jgi:membrane protease YdiL (CAAX protease family)
MSNAEEKRAWLRPELVASWWEIGTVLLFMDALWIYASSRSAWEILHGTYFRHYLTAISHLHVAGLQALTLATMFFYLHRRGWKPPDLDIRPSWSGCAQALVLTVLILAGSMITSQAMRDVFHGLHVTHVPFAPGHVKVSPHPLLLPVYWRWVILIAALAVNAATEEIVYLSYGFNQIAAKRGPGTAAVLTILLRITCHTYHGIYVVGNIVTFLIMTLWYWRTRNLWAVVLGHALFDLVLEWEGGAPNHG